MESYNPLAIESIAESIVRRLVETEPAALTGIPKFQGAGIYAIYYVGDFPVYSIIKQENQGGKWSLPIYVGKAVPKGARQGLGGTFTGNSTPLWSRLNQHAKSIQDASNLDSNDFYARWLIVDDIWIALGESALLRDTRPLWNSLIDGFGNHDPGRGRHQGLVPQWDTVHPGRQWASRLAERPIGTAEKIKEEAREYLKMRRENLNLTSRQAPVGGSRI